MPEYIEREAALKELNKNSITKKITLANGVSIYDTIKNLPAADVVEVVRCKVCKHWIYWADEKRCICDLHCTHTIRDDFCSFGVRKEGAEE